jgi:DNA-binding NtrC family response regulator
VAGFKPDALRRLQTFDWPGNVRQLENVIERAVILTRNPQVAVEDLPEEIRAVENGNAINGNGEVLPLKKAIEGPEKQIILRALKVFHGKRQATAGALGINRTTLYKKMKRYGIEGGGEG